MKGFAFALAILLISCGGLFAQSSPVPQLKVLQMIPLGGEGEWGFPKIDENARRLYLPRTNNVQILDLDKGTLVGVIQNVTAQVAHGVAMAPEQNLGFASAGKDNNVAAFDPATLKIVARIASSVNPNNVIFDPASKHIVVMNHAAVTIIDPANLKAKPVVIPMGDGLESAVADGKGNVYVCVENIDEVVRIDTKANKVSAHWSVAPGKTPAGISYDSVTNRLFVTTHSKASAAIDDQNGLLIVVDASSGKVISSAPIGAGASASVFDPALGVVLSSNGKDGTLSVTKETTPGKYETVQTLKTSLSARHVVLDPKTHRFFLPGNLPGTGSTAGPYGVIVVGLSDSN